MLCTIKAASNMGLLPPWQIGCSKPVTAICDLFVTCCALLVVCLQLPQGSMLQFADSTLSTCMQLSEWLAAYSGLQELGLAIAVTCIAIVAFGPLCDMFGGALFNPVHNVAMIIAGKGTWKMNLLRAVRLAHCCRC